MIFDSHAHYDDEAFDDDREELLNSMKKFGIGYIVNVGASMESTRASVELAQQYDFVYAAVGVHPSDAEGLNEDDMQRIKAYSALEKVVAIGEIGLDYHYPEPEKETQKKWFRRQLELAKEVSLPVIIHSRDAANDTLEILKEYDGRLKGGVIHCFSYSPEMAAEYVKMGYYIGIGGVLTFKNAKKLKEVADIVPIDRIVIETDCPYLSPEPHRGTRNTSLNLPYVIAGLAKIKGLSDKEIINITCRNAMNLYGISI